MLERRMKNILEERFRSVATMQWVAVGRQACPCLRALSGSRRGPSLMSRETTGERPGWVGGGVDCDLGWSGGGLSGCLYMDPVNTHYPSLKARGWHMASACVWVNMCAFLCVCVCVCTSMCFFWDSVPDCRLGVPPAQLWACECIHEANVQCLGTMQTGNINS